MTRLNCCFLAALTGALCCCGAEYTTTFARGQWRPDDWIMVKSPRWPHQGKFVQHDRFIANAVPPDATAAEMLGKRAHETYASMLLKKKFSGNLVIHATLEFADRMAPLIVITPDWGQSAAGDPEHREHFEIVLFDQGLNVWHHEFKDGKPVWHKAAYLTAPFKPNTPYELEIRLSHTRRGPVMEVRCGGYVFGYLEPSLPRDCHVGITGCEGINKFHHFSVRNK